MKCFITGISGFVGPYLAKHLIESGHEVSGIDKESQDVENCKVMPCDLLDSEKVSKIIAEESPDLIFHLAAQSSVPKSVEMPELTKKINVDGTKILLDAVLKAKINPKILIVSSAQLYGITDKVPITEDTPPNPQSPYAESRVEQEKLALSYNLQIFIARSFNHTGPGQQPFFVCPEFAKQLADIEKGKQEAVMNVGNLKPKIDFSDVRDVVRAYLLMVGKGVPGEIYNVCSGKAYSVQDILDILFSMSDAKVEVKQDPNKIRKKDVTVLLGSHEKLTKQTGWQPEITFEQTLKDILEYWRAQ